MKIIKTDLFIVFFIFLFVFGCNCVFASTDINILDYDCISFMQTNFGKKLKVYFRIIKYSVPALTIVLVGKDMITAIASGNNDNMKKAQTTSIKRLIIGLIIFLLPIILDTILSLVKFGSTCDISK